MLHTLLSAQLTPAALDTKYAGQSSLAQAWGYLPMVYYKGPVSNTPRPPMPMVILGLIIAPKMIYISSNRIGPYLHVCFRFVTTQPEIYHEARSFTPCMRPGVRIRYILQSKMSFIIESKTENQSVISYQSRSRNFVIVAFSIL